MTLPTPAMTPSAIRLENAVSPDETYVLVNETWRYRTKRVYVRGPREGVVETAVKIMTLEER